MSRYSIVITTRPLPVSPDFSAIGELIETVLLAQWYDRDSTGNDFDVVRTSDTVRATDTVAVDTAELIESVLKGTAITGTRTSATRFTRTAGTWVASGADGFWAYFYVSTAPYSGTWLRVAANTTTYLDVDGTIPTSANRVALCDRAGIRHAVSIGAQEGFVGTYFQTTITKAVPTDGAFRYFGLMHRVAVRENWTNESFAPGGTVGNGWTE